MTGKIRPLLVAAALFFPFMCQTASAGDNYVIAGASPGGLWSLLGAGIERAVTAEHPDATVTYQTSAGGFANIGLITRGDVDLGIAHNAELKLAVSARPPFSRAYSNLRAIAVLYDFALFHPLVTETFAEQFGVRSLDDIREKKVPLRVVINREGNIARDLAIEVFAAHGISLQDIADWGGIVLTAGSRDALNLVKGRRADMITNTVFVGHSVIREIAATMPVRLFKLDGAVLEEVASEMGISVKAIPASAYDWLDRDFTTLSLSAVLFADKSMDEQTAYELTHALIEHVDKVRSVHKSMADIIPETMGSLTTISYHRGAAMAFREVGIEVPSQ